MTLHIVCDAWYGGHLLVYYMREKRYVCEICKAST